MNKQWPAVRLNQVLRRSNETIELQPEAKYRQITLKLWGKGAVLRGILAGAEVAASRQIVARRNQFIVSRIDARNGAMGIVPEELDGAIVSNDFPVFNLVVDRMLPAYLGWMCKTGTFVEECRRASEGTTNRVRLQEEKFLASEIPLPPLTEQRRVVARIEGLADRIHEARVLRQEAAEQTDVILQSELHRCFITEENTWPQSTVGDCAEIIDPNPSHRMPHYAETGFPFISTVDFEGSEDIRRLTAKYVTEDTYLEQKSRCSFAVGDILYSRIGTIGAARLLTELWPFALSHVLVVVKPKMGIEPRFLLWYLRSDSITSQASHATRSIGAPISESNEFEAFTCQNLSSPNNVALLPISTICKEKQTP